MLYQLGVLMPEGDFLLEMAVENFTDKFLSLTRALWEPAPAQHSGLHTTYPNYHFWQLFGYLRIAKANIDWATGGDPCKFIVKKKKSLNKDMYDKFTQTANQYISLVTQKMEGFIKNYNAFEVGTIFAELQVQLADLKNEDIYEKEGTEEQLADDEITSAEAGFMEGYADTEEGVCSTCGKEIDPEKVIEKEVNDQLFTFCSQRCADIFDKRKAGLR